MSRDIRLVGEGGVASRLLDTGPTVSLPVPFRRACGEVVTFATRIATVMIAQSAQKGALLEFPANADDGVTERREPAIAGGRSAVH